MSLASSPPSSLPQTSLGNPDAREDKDPDHAFGIASESPPTDSRKACTIATRPVEATRLLRDVVGVNKPERLQRFRSSAHVLIAANRFKQAAASSQASETTTNECHFEDFSVSAEDLEKLTRDRDSELFEQLGTIPGIAERLQTSSEKGIADYPKEFQRRRHTFGDNSYPKKAPKTFIMFVWMSCKDKTVIWLMGYGVISIALGTVDRGQREGWNDGASILSAVLVVICVTAITNYRQSLLFRELYEQKNKIQVQVVRGGRRSQIFIFNLVVGDLVPLQIGDQVPADGLLVSGYALWVDESKITGKSELVRVGQHHPFLLSGTNVADGYGSMLVTTVGQKTEWGKIMAAKSDNLDEETPLQVRLNSLATSISRIGISVAALVILILLLFYFTGHSTRPNHKKRFKAGETNVGDAFRSLLDICSIALAKIAVAVPEGFPLAMTLALSQSMKQMMADKALIHRLPACDTMGSATAICCHKKGIVTPGQMTVVRAWVAGDVMESATVSKPVGSCVSDLLIEGISHRSSRNAYIPGQGVQLEVSGSPTEKALLSWGLTMELNFEEARSKSSVLHLYAFNSEQQRTCVVLKVESSEDIRVHFKGDAKFVLNTCDYWTNAEGKLHDITNEWRKSLESLIEAMAERDLYCSALAYKNLEFGDAPSDDEWEPWTVPDKELTLLAIVGMENHCTPVVCWERSVYLNIQKFIQFQLTVNTAALAINLISAISSGDASLTAVQFLWVNLIMDTLGALALATEMPNDNILHRPAVSLDEPLITNAMLRNLLGQVVFQVAVFLTLFFRGQQILQLEGPNFDIEKKTVIFNTFVLCQIFNKINARKLDDVNIFKGILKNHIFLAIVMISLITQVVVIEFLGQFAKTTRLDWQKWLVCVSIAFLSWPVAFMVKCIPIPEKPVLSAYLEHGRKEQKGGSNDKQMSMTDRFERGPPIADAV